MRSMHVLMFLLPVLQLCFQAQAASLSTLTMKRHVSRAAERLVNKLGNVTIPQPLSTSPPSWEQQYKYSVCYVFQFLNMSSKLISDSFILAQDIKSELASLSGFLDQSRQCHCSSVSDLVPPKALVALQARRNFSVSVTLTVYHRLKKYLKNLEDNLDQLDTCL